MSKATLNMYAKLLVKRLESKSITVSSLYPVWTQTDMGGRAALRLPKEVTTDILYLLNNNVKSGYFGIEEKLGSGR